MEHFCFVYMNMFAYTRIVSDIMLMCEKLMFKVSGQTILNILIISPLNVSFKICFTKTS